MPRGGARTGRVGKAYPNRTDLTPTALPATAAQGQPYGQAGAQIAAQKAVPMASGPLQSSPISQTPQGPMPGSLTGVADPTQNPNEHLMTGVNVGPGPGSEALNPTLPPDPANEALALLNTLTVKSPAVKSVVDFLSLQAQNQMPH